MIRIFAAIFLAAYSWVATASECAQVISDKYQKPHVINTCNVKIGPINFCWESQESDCSCFKGSACSAGPLSPGSRTRISGPGRKEQTEWRMTYCVYEEWVSGECHPKDVRDSGGYANQAQPGRDRSAARRHGSNELESLLDQQTNADRQAEAEAQMALGARARQIEAELASERQKQAALEAERKRQQAISDQQWRENRERSQAEFSQAIGAAVGAIGAAAANRQRMKQEMEANRRATSSQNDPYTPTYTPMLGESCQAPCGVK